MPPLTGLARFHGESGGHAAALAPHARPAKPGRRALPGFRLTLGFTLLYLSLLVLVPLGAAVLKASSPGWP